MDAKFKRDHKLLNGKQFKAVFDHRQRYHGSFFSLHTMPNDLEHHRLGLAVSKKVSKKAVERNRIKRQVRESFRHLQQTTMTAQTLSAVGAAKKLDWVAVAKPAAACAAKNALSQELSKLWLKVLK